MSFNIVDKRKVTRDRSVENRQRFLRRIKSTIKEQLPDLINGRSLKDMDAKGGNIIVKRKSIKEPFITHDHGGNIDYVLTGNKEHVAGDYIAKPPRNKSSGGGPKATNSGQSTDDFIVELTREEFLKEFFDDLALPDLAKTELSKVYEERRENAGYQPSGSPTKLALIRSVKNSYARKHALAASMNGSIEEINEQIKLETDPNKIDYLKELIAELELRKLTIPMFDDMDMRYRQTVIHRDPSIHATMILLMDISGSMGQKEKTIARKFFWLLYRFLLANYEKVDLRFVAHTIVANELDEDTFFSTRETGGTIVSSGLDEVVNIIKGQGKDWQGEARQSMIGKTNIYVAQVSDGDNYDGDNGTCTEILEDDILPNVQYYSYVQVDSYRSSDASISSLLTENGLWRSYQSVGLRNKKLQARRVVEESDIFPVFHELFAKKETK